MCKILINSIKLFAEFFAVILSIIDFFANIIKNFNNNLDELAFFVIFKL
jgi:hypothetical protein